jgi:hypothetical protein
MIDQENQQSLTGIQIIRKKSNVVRISVIRCIKFG